MCSTSDAKIVHNKATYIEAILRDFIRMNTYFISLTNDQLFPYIHGYVSSALETDTHLILISKYFDAVYGISVSAALRTPTWTIDTRPDRVDDVWVKILPWLACNISTNTTHVPHNLSLKNLTECMQGLHASLRPLYKASSKQSCWNAIIHHVWQQSWFLLSLGSQAFFEQFLSCKLFTDVCGMSHLLLIQEILEYEYGPHIMKEVGNSVLTVSERKKKVRRDEKLNRVKLTAAFKNKIVTSWPSKISDDVIFQCLHDYYNGTQWTLPHACAVCSREQRGVEMYIIKVENNVQIPPLNLELLLLDDPFIIQHCIIQCLSSEFIFGHQALDGLMLYKDSVHLDDCGNVSLDVCTECNSSLLKKEMPQYALANNLYCGQLPAQFSDLTWVEEMVCARYCNTAHIT
jgi:hypothetical protein